MTTKELSVKVEDAVRILLEDGFIRGNDRKDVTNLLLATFGWTVDHGNYSEHP